jgi:hypothetical protein
MVKRNAKKSVEIPPTRIDNDFFVKLGKVLKTECPNYLVHISLFSDSIDIQSEDKIPEDYTEFEKEEIPTDTYKISITSYPRKAYTDMEEPSETFPVEIEIDCQQPRKSKIRIHGEKAGWVEGTTKTILDVFKKKRLGYRHIAKYSSVRAAISWISAGFLAFAVGYLLWSIKIEALYYGIGTLISFAIFIETLRRFYDWVFPYFEIGNEDFKPKKFRKLAYGILVASYGIIQTIILKLLGF